MVKSIEKLLVQYAESALNETKREHSTTPAIFKVHGINECVEYISSMRGVSDLEILSTYITVEGYDYIRKCPRLTLDCNYDNENFWRHISNNINPSGHPALNARESRVKDPKQYVSEEQLLRHIFEESEFKKLGEYGRILTRDKPISRQSLVECIWGAQGVERRNYYIEFDIVDLIILHMHGPDATNDFRRFEKMRLREEIKELKADLRDI